MAVFQRRISGQAMIETALLFLGVTTALVLFFSFVRASVSGRVKAGADAFGFGLQCDGAARCK